MKKEYNFYTSNFTFKNEDKLLKEFTKNSNSDVVGFYEEGGRIIVTSDLNEICGFICRNDADRAAVAELICSAQGINPVPTRGRGGLDGEGGFGHICRGNRRCPEGYNFGYAF